jgi:uncharacterized membrane protein YeaQ/YmgE (transglycosylase-associated protein family)
MTLVDIILWIVVGAIAGWVAQALVGGGFGLIGTIVLGIIGAIVGGFVGGLLGIGGTTNNPFNIVSLILAIIGAIIVLLIARTVAGRRTVV